ncbi:hypothetical protein HYZ76_01230 [Candidatus Falkowbacteria bacterium]|nr:hypothetical protein [Candidatus Falkowbacteria bacterium]
MSSVTQCWCGKSLENGLCPDRHEPFHVKIDRQLFEKPLCWCGSPFGVLINPAAYGGKSYKLECPLEGHPVHSLMNKLNTCQGILTRYCMIANIRHQIPQGRDDNSSCEAAITSEFEAVLKRQELALEALVNFTGIPLY